MRRPPVADPVRRLALTTAAGFALLTSAVAASGQLPGERWLLARTSAGDGLDAVARVVDAVTGYLPVGLVTGVLVLLLLRLGRVREAVLAVLCVGGAIAGTTAWKHLVQRDRPELLPAGADVSALSYPSGHAAATAALAVLVVLLARRTRWSTTAWWGAAALVGVPAVAQLLLARHHPSDLAGGWLWAVAWTTGVWATGRGRPSGS